MEWRRAQGIYFVLCILLKWKQVNEHVFHLHFINMRVLTIQKNGTKRVLYSTREENEHKSQWFHVSKMRMEMLNGDFYTYHFGLLCVYKFFCEE